MWSFLLEGTDVIIAFSPLDPKTTFTCDNTKYQVVSTDTKTKTAVVKVYERKKR